jgi:hypothetical protein
MSKKLFFGRQPAFTPNNIFRQEKTWKERDRRSDKKGGNVRFQSQEKEMEILFVYIIVINKVIDYE